VQAQSSNPTGSFQIETPLPSRPLQGEVRSSSHPRPRRCWPWGRRRWRQRRRPSRWRSCPPAPAPTPRHPSECRCLKAAVRGLEWACRLSRRPQSASAQSPLPHIHPLPSLPSQHRRGRASCAVPIMRRCCRSG